MGALEIDTTLMHALIGEARLPWRAGVERMVRACAPELLRAAF